MSIIRNYYMHQYQIIIIKLFTNVNVTNNLFTWQKAAAPAAGAIMSAALAPPARHVGVSEPTTQATFTAPAAPHPHVPSALHELARLFVLAGAQEASASH